MDSSFVGWPAHISYEGDAYVDCSVENGAVVEVKGRLVGVFQDLDAIEISLDDSSHYLKVISYVAPPEEKKTPDEIIQYTLPVKESLTIADLLKGERPWINVKFNLLPESRYYEYISGFYKHPERYLNDNYKFGSLDSWLEIKNIAGSRVLIKEIRVYVKALEASTDGEIIGDWNYVYEHVIREDEYVSPNGKLRIPVSVPLYLVNIFPHWDYDSPNVMYYQHYIVHYEIRFEYEGREYTLPTYEFSVYGVSIRDEIKMKIIKAVFETALQGSVGKIKSATEFAIEFFRRVIDFIIKFLLENSDKTLVSLMEKQGELKLRILDSKGTDITPRDSEHYMEIGFCKFALVPRDISEFTVQIDASQAEEQVESYNLSIHTFRDGQIKCSRSVQGEIAKGSKKKYNIRVNDDGKGILIEEVGGAATHGQSTSVQITDLVLLFIPVFAGIFILFVLKRATLGINDDTLTS